MYVCASKRGVIILINYFIFWCNKGPNYHFMQVVPNTKFTPKALASKYTLFEYVPTSWFARLGGLSHGDEFSSLIQSGVLRCH